MEYALPPNPSDEVLNTAADEDHLPSYDELPPSYETLRRRIEHAFSLADCKFPPVLKLTSAASSSKNAPLYVPGDTISGFFELDMTQTGRNNLEQIDIRLMGQIIQPLAKRTTVEPFERGSDVIVDYSHTVWTECAPIEGKFSVPFAIQIPSVTLNGKPLPASATESKGCFGIRYEVFAHMRRGRLRADYKFGSLVNYMAGKRPEASSPLRQSAYENGTAIPGPKEDPDYWKTLEPVTIHGTVFRHREVEIECQLSLARPLCYTRGTAIPCVLGIESDDEDALALLSSPSAVNLRLQRTVTWGAYGADPDYYKESLCSKGALDYPARATWGPVLGQGRQRRLEGEIQLSSCIEASLAYDENYSASASAAVDHPSGLHSDSGVLQYKVALFAFQSPSFKPRETCGRPVLLEPVEITNVFAVGPRARQLLPPARSLPTIEGSMTSFWS